MTEKGSKKSTFHFLQFCDFEKIEIFEILTFFDFCQIEFVISTCGVILTF